MGARLRVLHGSRVHLLTWLCVNPALPRVALDDRLALGVAEHAVDKFEPRGSELLDFVDHALRSALAVEAHDLGGLGEPLRFVVMQRLHRVVGLSQPVGEAARVEDRLRGAVGADGVHRMGGVAQQRDAAEAPMGQRVAVAHGIFPADRRRAHQRLDIDAGNFEAPGVGDHLLHASDPRPGIDRRRRDLAVGDARAIAQLVSRVSGVEPGAIG